VSPRHEAKRCLTVSFLSEGETPHASRRETRLLIHFSETTIHGAELASTSNALSLTQSSKVVR